MVPIHKLNADEDYQAVIFSFADGEVKLPGAIFRLFLKALAAFIKLRRRKWVGRLCSGHPQVFRIVTPFGLNLSVYIGFDVRQADQFILKKLRVLFLSLRFHKNLFFAHASPDH